MDKVAFDTALADDALRIAFVGMSNAGKTYRSKALQNEKDFMWIDIDAHIGDALGLASMDALAAWMGYPNNEHFAKRQDEYLRLETAEVLKACTYASEKNIVCDTTGSVIHIPEHAQQKLKERFLVVHLNVGDDGTDRMMEKFFAHPKPVVWDGFFNMQEGELVEDALRRCYPALLQERLKRYSALAHVEVPAQLLRDSTAEKTLALIREYL